MTHTILLSLHVVDLHYILCNIIEICYDNNDGEFIK